MIAKPFGFREPSLAMEIHRMVEGRLGVGELHVASAKHSGQGFASIIQQLELVHAFLGGIRVGPDDLLVAGNLGNFGLRRPGGVVAENDVAVGEPGEGGGPI